MRIVLMVTLSLCHGLLGFGREPKSELNQVIAKASPAVVTLRATRAASASLGSGFLIGPHTIMTNAHVVEDALQIEVTLADGKSAAVKGIVAEDSRIDLALVDLDADVPDVVPLVLSNVLPERGDPVLVIGSPRGLEQSVSNGIVSSVRADPDSGTVVQITAAMSPGNSGGPVLDMRGQVVGVATFKVVGGENLNFAVAATVALSLKPGEVRPLLELPALQLPNAEIDAEAWNALPRDARGKLEMAKSYYLLLPDGTPVDAFGYFLEFGGGAFEKRRTEYCAYVGLSQGKNEQVEVNNKPAHVEAARADRYWHFVHPSVDGPAIKLQEPIRNTTCRFAMLNDQAVILKGKAVPESLEGVVLWKCDDAIVHGRGMPVYAVIPVDQLRPGAKELATALLRKGMPIRVHSFRRRTYQRTETQYGPGTPGYRQQYTVPVGPVEVTYEWNETQIGLRPMPKAKPFASDDLAK